MMSPSVHLRAPLLSTSANSTTTTTTSTTTNNRTKTKSKSETKNTNTSHTTTTLITPSSEQIPSLPSLPTFLPTTNQLLGRWHVTHSTLPMWKDKRNVSITYALLPPLFLFSPAGSTSSADTKGRTDPTGSEDPKSPKGTSGDEIKLTRLEDTVRYQKKKQQQQRKKKAASDANNSGGGGGSGGGAVSTVRGIDTAVREWSVGTTTTTSTTATATTAAATATAVAAKQGGTVDAPSSETETETEPENHMRWRWKGTGLLTRWFTSEWEVLGFGVDDYDNNHEKEKNSRGGNEQKGHNEGGSGAGAGDDNDAADARNYWVVTYFSKTLVTPAGIDILSQRPEGPTGETVKRIREALREVPNEEVRRLEGMIFQVENEVEAEAEAETKAEGSSRTRYWAGSL